MAARGIATAGSALTRTVNPGGVMRRPAPVAPKPKPPTLQGKTIGQWWGIPKGSTVSTYAPAAPTFTPSPNQPSPYSGTTTPPAAPAFDPNTFDPNTDPVYRQNVTTQHRTTMGKVAGLQKQVTDAQTGLPTFDYTTGIEDPRTGAFSGAGATLGRQHALDVLAAQIAANRGGGLFSSSLAQRIGDVDRTYAGKYTTALDAYQKLAQLIGTPDAQGLYAPGTQIAGLLGDESVYDTGEFGNAVSRASQAAQNNPALGLPTTSLAPVAPARTAEMRLLAPGARLPAFTLTPPKGAPASARWSGGAKPPGNWRGISGGWWVPTK